MEQKSATFIGFGAILLWAFLALFTVGAGPIPPFQLTAISFAIGGTIGLIWVLKNGNFTTLKSISPKIYLFGTASLFGYHLFYFTALQTAPAAEAGLIAYLWPLLIVLFSGLLPNETLKKGHVIGASISFAGIAIMLASNTTGFHHEAIFGYGLAALCALTWSGYSVYSRRLGHIPTDSIAVFCVLTAILSAIAHFSFETTVWPQTGIAWASVALLGIGPVGIAFYVWDVGMKKGNIQILGVISYATPLLSTIVLITAGIADLTAGLFVAAAMVSLGAIIAATSR